MNNTTVNVTLSQPLRDEVNALVYAICVACTGWTLGSNVIIISCFFHNRRRNWSDFSRLTCSMAMSDIWVAVTGATFLAIEQVGVPVNTALCITLFYFFFATQCISLLHVLGICIFRNIKLQSVTEPSVPSRRQLINTRHVIGIAWALALGIVLVPFSLWSHQDTARSYCVIDRVFESNIIKAMEYIGSFYFTSQMLTNTVYLLTCCRVWSAIRRIAPISNEQENPPPVASIHSTGNGANSAVRMPRSRLMLSSLRNQRHVMGTIGILLFLFNIFTMPVTLVMLSGLSRVQNRNVRYITTILFIMNSGLNPIVYAIRIPSLRNSLKSAFHRIIGILR